MKKLLSLSILALCSLVLLTGCAGQANVPSTDISVDFTKGIAHISSPKQIRGTNWVIEIPNGTKVNFGSIESLNDSTVLSVITQQNFQQGQQILQGIDKLNGLATQIAGKVATGGIAP